jgi:hypothetical protein
MFVCPQTKFLCYHSMGNAHGMAEIIWRTIFRYPEAVLYLDGNIRKDSNIDLTDCLWCPAFIWQYANMLRYTKLDWVVNVSSDINLDPMFVCPQTKFLCYHSMGNAHGMAEMLTLMSKFISEDTFTTQSSFVYLNMLAYK